MEAYTYNARDEALVAWNASFTSRIGDGGGDAEEEYLELVKLLATCKSGGRLLDIGCGLGRIIGLVGRRGGSIVGLEPDATRFRECHAAFHDGRRVHVLRTTSTDYRRRHPHATFDLIVVSMVIQHVSTATCDGILADVAGLLAPDGLAVIATTQQDEERFTFQGDQTPRSAADFDRYAADSGAQSWGIPVRQFSRASFHDALHRGGLEVVRWGQFSYLRPAKVSWFAAWMGSTPDAIRDLGTSQYAVVRRP